MSLIAGGVAPSRISKGVCNLYIGYSDAGQLLEMRVLRMAAPLAGISGTNAYDAFLRRVSRSRCRVNESSRRPRMDSIRRSRMQGCLRRTRTQPRTFIWRIRPIVCKGATFQKNGRRQRTVLAWCDEDLRQSESALTMSICHPPTPF